MTDAQKSDYKIMNEVGKTTILKPDYRMKKIQDMSNDLNI